MNGVALGLAVVSPNVAIDSYYLVPALDEGEVNRATRSSHTAGGKGINMARAYRSLGGHPCCLGLVGGLSGDFIEAELDREGIASRLVRVPAETRRTTSIIEEGSGRTTVIADPGKAVPASAADELSTAIERHGGDAPWLALVGSLPPGFPHTYFADHARAARRRGQSVAIDAAGATLAYALSAGPTLVKVNRSEMSQALGPDAAFDRALLDASFEEMAADGVECLIVTDGHHGAYVLATGTEPFTVTTPVARVVSAVGAGDTFLGAFIRARETGAGVEGAAMEASAAAAANVLQVGCGVLDPDDLDRLRGTTRIVRPLRVAA
jgi:1-phosphofructokinase family hexose kinase